MDVCVRVHVNYNETEQFTWTQIEMMSANCDNDFSGQLLESEGSTILDNDAMSWSWLIAHLARCCSPRGLELYAHVHGEQPDKNQYHEMVR